MRRDRVLFAAVLGIGLLGCAVDVPQLMKSDTALQTRVMETISADSTLAATMVDHLLQGDDTRDALLDRLLANGGAAQEVMMRVATDRTRLDGVISLAVQDSSTKDHVVTLVRGMQMAGAR